MSGILNKVKEVVAGATGSEQDNTRHTTGTTGTGAHNTGSNVMHPEGYGSGQTGYGSGQTGYGSGQTGYGSTNTGPHDSNVANKLDPRIDSDRDGSRTNEQYGSSTGGYGSSNTGYGSSNTEYGSSNTGYGSSTTTGSHNSNLANKLDPRVDSDRDGSRTTGTTGEYGSSTGGYGSGSHHHHQEGQNYSSLLSDNVASKVDPRHESSTLGSTGVHHGNHGMSQQFEDYTTTGTGTGTHHHGTTGGITGGTTGYGSSSGGYGSNTSGYDTTGNNSGYNTSGNINEGSHGPHKSSLLNKLDPRVDNTSTNTSHTGGGYSSGTGDYAPGTGNAGGAETMFSHHKGGIPSSEGTTAGTGPYAGKDTYDASQVPPSAFQREAGHHMSTGGSKSGGAF